MEANEAPKKIHIQPNAHDGWFEGSIPNGLPNGLFVEYIRTDTFIEKVCEWIRENWREYINVDKDGVVCFGHWERDFKKYLEE